MCRKFLAPVCICVALLCFSGCYDMSVLKSSNQTSTVRIYLNGSDNRALAIPDAVSQIQSYAVSITGGMNPPPAQSFNVADPITFSNVYIANNYTVTVTAYSVPKTIQSASTLLGSGSATFNVTGLSTAVAVTVTTGTVTPLTGRGSINLTIQYPVSQNVTAITATMTGAAVVTPTVALGTPSGSYNTAVISTPPIQSGQYIMQLIFIRAAGGSSSISESVLVYDNAITNNWIVDSTGAYNAVLQYNNIFTSTNSYLANLKLSTTSSTQVPLTDASFVNMPNFVSSTLTDPVNYVVRCAKPQFQFMPVPGQNGQTVNYYWTTGAIVPVWTELDTANTSVNPPSITAANGTLQIKVTAPDMVSTSVYSISFIKDFTLTYSANGATSGTAPASAIYQNGNIPLAAQNTGNLQFTGMIFNGWNTQANGLGLTYFPGNALPPMVSDLTLYAKWNNSTLTFTVTSVNPITLGINFNIPTTTPVISKKDNPAANQLTVNLIQGGTTYQAGATKWSYTTGLIPTPVYIPAASNGAANPDTGLVWSPSPTLTNGDYIFTVQATIISNGIPIPCTGYFKVTVVN